MSQEIFILGATGKVGRTLVSQIFEKGDTDKNHKNPTKIVGLASHNNYSFNPMGMSFEEAIEFSERGRNQKEYVSLENLLDIAKLPPNLVFVDATNGKKDMAQFHLNAIENNSYGIVTANKNPLVLFGCDVFDKLTQEVKRYGFRCSVMAGAEAVDKLQDLRDLGDEILEIEGCFSGTLGYLISEMERGKKFSDVIAEAQKKGYTEKDPRIDLSGEDVAKKILILARVIGMKVDYNDISLSPFLSISSLEENLTDIDSYFMDKIDFARSSGKVLRYVAKINPRKSKMEVALEEVSKDGHLGSLRGTSNKIVIYSKTYSSQPYIVQAPGAGLEITAQNIRRDLLKQLTNRRIK